MKRTPENENRLTYLEDQFVRVLTNPDSPETYMKPYHAYRHIRPNVSEATARDAPYKVLQRERVKNAVEQELEKHQFGKGNRANILAQIGKGELTMIREVVTKDGEIIQTTVEPSFSDRLKAIETANRMDGSYEQQKLDADIAREEHKKIEEELLKEVRNVSPKKKK